MWSVTMTDAVQLVLLLLGIVVLAFTVVSELAGGGTVAMGLERLGQELPAAKLVLIPTEDLAVLVGWLSIVAVGILGNIPGQDLAQRIFASRTANIAMAACLIAGVAYIVFGLVPVMTGLAAEVLAIESGDSATLPLLAATLMSPTLGIVFVLALVSAVMSTIDSAILAPSSILSNNLLTKLWPRQSALRLSRLATLGIALVSVVVAYAGQDAYDLLETAYAIGMVGLFAPLAIGLHSTRGGEGAALAAMVVGTGVWGVHLVLGWETFGGPALSLIEIPQEIIATTLGWIAYEAVAYSSGTPASSSPSIMRE
jgi:Na+/proline symporter